MAMELEDYEWPKLIAWRVGFLKTWQLPFNLFGESGRIKNFPEGVLLFCSCQAMQR